MEGSTGGGDSLRKRKRMPLGKMNWTSLHRAEVEGLLAQKTVPQTEQTLKIEDQRRKESEVETV